MKEIEILARQHLLNLKPYSSARDEFKGEAEVFLDANENALGSVAAWKGFGALHRYPDPHQLAIKQKLAVLKGVEPEQIFIGNGSDEPIDLLIRLFCRPAIDQIITMPPTYGMYEVCAGINEVFDIQVPLRPDFQPDLAALLEAFSPHTKILFLCSPNNPTGNLIEKSTIETILQRFPGIVVIDEAYVDFSSKCSWISRIQEFPRLVVLQTFSKAWGLAALRAGMAIAHPFLVSLLNRIKPPYNISGPTQEAIAYALDHVNEKQAHVNHLLNERKRIEHKLNKLPCVEKVFSSDANFLLVKFTNSQEVFEVLKNRGIIVRDRSKNIHCHNCLRITIGTRTENNKMLEALKLVCD
jgi:histidinol-phosphate aminotransferase